MFASKLNATQNSHWTNNERTNAANNKKIKMKLIIDLMDKFVSFIALDTAGNLIIL
jgi:hypothetical protein